MTRQTSTRRNYKAEARARAARINGALAQRASGVCVETGMGAYLIVGMTDDLWGYGHRRYGDGSVSEFRDKLCLGFEHIASIEEALGCRSK